MDRLTREQAAILSAYTGMTCGPYIDLRDYVEKKLGSGTITDSALVLLGEEGVRRLAKEDFFMLCAQN